MDEVLTVTGLNRYLKNVIEGDINLRNLKINGEVSNFRPNFSGHLYFNIKDETSVISCVMFKGAAKNLEFIPKDGDSVDIIGDIQVYLQGGKYQILVKKMQKAGLGDLYIKFEELKKQLQEKGYFDDNRKKEIPFYPKRIGVLTSPTGSVIRDIINVGSKRNPKVNILLCPVAVQGDKAAANIAAGINYMNTRGDIDVLIVGRGGGSLEDLWSFNEQIVADAIYNSNIPIISAVGHETDFTISDFVADKRAATPSQAAEFAVPELQNILETINVQKRRIYKDVKTNLDYLKQKTNMYKAKLKTPQNIVNEKRYEIDRSISKIKQEVDETFRYQKARLEVLEEKLISTSLKNNILKRKSEIEKNIIKIANIVKTKYMNKSNELKLYKEKINALGPSNVLKRGYTLIKLDNKLIKNAKQLNKGDKIEIEFYDNKKKAEVLD